jgi:hypothetical protein
MRRGPFHMHLEVARDDGAFEAINERVVILRTVGQLGATVNFAAYGVGYPGAYKPGDIYDLVRREPDPVRDVGGGPQRPVGEPEIQGEAGHSTSGTGSPGSHR